MFRKLLVSAGLSIKSPPSSHFANRTTSRFAGYWLRFANVGSFRRLGSGRTSSAVHCKPARWRTILQGSILKKTLPAGRFEAQLCQAIEASEISSLLPVNHKAPTLIALVNQPAFQLSCLRGSSTVRRFCGADGLAWRCAC
jgi:hypothetical protein